MDSTIVIAEDSNNIMNKPETLKKTGLGERLRTAREAMRLTPKEAAARLHLNVNIIALMENESFTDGPPAAFMRGYLRSYARSLNLSENEIQLTLKSLESSLPYQTTAPIINLPRAHQGERYLRWLTYLIVLTLCALVSIWWSSHSRYATVDVPAKISQPALPPQSTTLPSSNLSAVAPKPVEPTLATPNKPAPVKNIEKARNVPAVSNMIMALPEPNDEPDEN
jgi:cytoskeleton protein RodZ